MNDRSFQSTFSVNMADKYELCVFHYKKKIGDIFSYLISCVLLPVYQLHNIPFTRQEFQKMINPERFSEWPQRTEDKV